MTSLSESGFFRFRLPVLLPVLLSVLLAFGCSPGFQLSKSNRTGYAIDQKMAVDSAIVRFYLPYKAKMEAEMSQVIGHSAVLMSKKSSDTLPESLLSNFFADAVMREAKKRDPSIDFGMPSTKGGLRVDLPKGDVTVSNIFELMPFENETVVYTLTGRQVMELLDFVASTNGQPVTGISLKIKDLKLLEAKVNGQEIDPDKTYRVLTSDYIGGGGDKVPVFKDIKDRKILGLKIRDALMDYVREMETQGKLLNSSLDGRIVKL